MGGPSRNNAATRGLCHIPGLDTSRTALVCACGGREEVLPSVLVLELEKPGRSVCPRDEGVLVVFK